MAEALAKLPLLHAKLEGLKALGFTGREGLQALGFTGREVDAAGRAAVALVGANAPRDALMRPALAAARAGPAGRASSGASGPGAPHTGARPS